MEGWDSPPQQKQINKNNKQTNINGNYKIGNHLPPSQSNCLLFQGFMWDIAREFRAVFFYFRALCGI